MCGNNSEEIVGTVYYIMSWTERALEHFFVRLTKEEYENDKINSSKVYCGTSKLVEGQRGVFARTHIKKGEVVEWGIATVIPGFDVKHSDLFYAWDSTDRKKAATVSGCALFYNTKGDQSNARCVPYHAEERFEIYALEDIDVGGEVTIRYDSMNYRDSMQHLLPIVGELVHGDKV